MKKIKIVGPEKVSEPVKKMIKEVEDQINLLGVEIQTVSLSPYYNDRENRVEFFAAVTYEGEIKVDPIIEQGTVPIIEPETRGIVNIGSEINSDGTVDEIEVPVTIVNKIKKDNKKNKKNKKGKK